MFARELFHSHPRLQLRGHSRQPQPLHRARPWLWGATAAFSASNQRRNAKQEFKFCPINHNSHRIHAWEWAGLGCAELMFEIKATTGNPLETQQTAFGLTARKENLPFQNGNFYLYFMSFSVFMRQKFSRHFNH